MPEDLKSCLHILLRILKTQNKKQRDKLIVQYDACVVKSMRNICLNVLKGNLDLTVPERATLKKYKISLRKLANGQISMKSRRKLILKDSHKLLKNLMPPLLRRLQHV